MEQKSYCHYSVVAYDSMKFFPPPICQWEYKFTTKQLKIDQKDLTVYRENWSIGQEFASCVNESTF